MYETGDTIVAAATPPSEGAIGIVRLSGKKAKEIFSAAAKFKKPISKWQSRKLYRVTLFSQTGETVDDGFAALFKAPASYTGEDLIEFYGHGGALVISAAVRLFIERGARAAGPGEFTRRAFIAGKLDLAQAEAVAATITAKSELGLIAARRQLEGGLSKAIGEISASLVSILGEAEAYIDFPEEDLPPQRRDLMLETLGEAAKALERLANSFQAGKAATEGIVVVFAGRPNAGKSSLYNALTEKERAIVTPVAGTTRDALTATLPFAGIMATFVDTAGLRESGDAIEMEGMRRAKEWLEKADIALWVIDGGAGVAKEEEIFFKEKLIAEKTICVWNKCDLKRPAEGFSDIMGGRFYATSCLTGEGISELKRGLEEAITAKYGGAIDEITLTSERHFDIAKRAAASIKRAAEIIESEGATELAAEDIKSALEGFSQITGQDVSEATLDYIFGRFCIGK